MNSLFRLPTFLKEFRRWRLIEFAVLFVFLLGIAYRLYSLYNLPGLNSDEAEWSNKMLAVHLGEPWSWRTPFGKILNPGLCIPLWILTGLFAPDIWIIKFPAVASGLLLIGLSYPLIRRAFDERVALTTTLLLTASPMAIGYSRIGWDPCQSTLACLLAIGAVYRQDLRFRKRLIYGAIAFSWACVIHPTNVFLLPVLAAPIGVSLFRLAHLRWTMRQPQPKSVLRVMALIFGFLILASIAVKAFELVAGGWTSVSSNDLKIYLYRLTSYSEWRDYWVQFGRLISGINLMLYVVGMYSYFTVAVHDWAFRFFFLSVILPGTFLLIKNRRNRELTLLAGFAVALVAFESRASSGAMIPALERYSQWLLVPCMVYYGACLREIAETLRKPSWVLPFLVTLCGLQLWSVQKNYFEDLLKYGGRNHWTFFTGPEEPKRAAYQAIRADSREKLSVVVWAEDFWSAEALRFFSHRQKEWVIRSSPPGDELNLNWVLQELNFGQYIVGFQNGPTHFMVQKIPAGYPLQDWVFNAFDGRPILHVWKKKL